jgi:indolepyruvate ferredoxin oxidoreductase alpha subunit
MAKFREMVESPAGSKFIVQGNEAFALGVVHAGFHCADGYPGTPSTEVIDRALSKVQDKINVGWDVNEAVAVGVGVGHAVAGYDTVVTMKTPGAFQAGDAITTSAFYHGEAGALVLYVASDYVPSSTQHVIDLRPFFASSRIPVLEPRSHQEMYEIPWQAADISREFNTPVAVLASGILCHSDGLITTKEPRTVEPRELPENLHDWMLMPNLARLNYDHATTIRIPSLQNWVETSDLVKEIGGDPGWGIIVGGESDMIVREALRATQLSPAILSLAALYPIPKSKIKAFSRKIKGKIFVFEDGDQFLEEKIRLLGIDIVGKGEYSTITEWTPQTVLEFLARHVDLDYKTPLREISVQPVRRPPSICPGCPYRALSLAVDKLKRQKKIYASFGDIGCSTLLFFLNALDTCMCMGASDSMRQGFVLSRPDMANKVISVIGDSCECHSGLDATRNAVFRNIPGVKVVLDNRVTAMTGGQPAPSSQRNLAGVPNKFKLQRALEAEECGVVIVDSYDLKGIEEKLKEALKLAEQGEYTTMILEGPCIHQVENRQKFRRLKIDYDKCKRCGSCNICPGIELDDQQAPHFTHLCTNCAGNTQVCMQRCPFGAIERMPEDEVNTKEDMPVLPKLEVFRKVEVNGSDLPQSLRLAIRGIGGQGNLFFGKVLAEVVLQTPYADNHIVKGDTHGMAQLGGAVISTFACGDVYSPTFAPGSTDVLVVMEMNEALRPGFLELLKPDGVVIFNAFRALPPGTKLKDCPDIVQIREVLAPFEVIEIDASKIARDLGDKSSRSANVVVLGLLSTVKPFSAIPEAIWLRALISVSPSEVLRTANILAFRAGRKRGVKV